MHINAINAIRYAESITPRWIRLAVSDEPNRWANDWATWQHQHLFVVHATDELGIRGISMDMRVKPGAASQGYGPVACGYAVPYNPLRPLWALEMRSTCRRWFRRSRVDPNTSTLV